MEMLLTVLAAEAIWESGKEVLKMKGAGLLEKFGEGLLSRTRAGELPTNHDLVHALRRSLCKATRVLAHTIHEPDRPPLSQLFADLKVGSLADRLTQVVQGNIVPRVAHDYWLVELIEKSGKQDDFSDFDLDLDMMGIQPSSLVHGELNQRLCNHTQKEFLTWCGRHITVNPHKPSTFDNFVRDGWPLPGGGEHKITFYEIFCLFFREELKHNEIVFRAFTTNTLADLKADIAKVLAIAPSAEERTRLEKAIHKLDDFAGFKEFLDSQNLKLFASLARIEAGVGRLETGQTDLKAGMELLLENQQAIFDEIKRPQMVRAASETDGRIPQDIEAIIKEAGKSINEGRYAEARQKLESARQRAETQNCAAALMEIRIDIAETHVLENSDITATRDDLLNLLRELSKDTQAKKRREVLNLLGDAESLLGNLENAKSLFRESRQLAQKQQSRFAEARALVGLSHAEEFFGNLKEANSLLDEATELYRAEYREATDDEKPRAAINLGACLSTKAMLVRREAKLAESVLYLTKAEPFFREAKSFDNLGRTIMFKAETLFTEAKWQEGFEALTESLSIFKSIGNITWQCRCLDRFARFFFMFDKEEQALACLENILRLVGSGQPEIAAVPYLLKFVHLCRKQDENEKAKGFVNRAKAIAVKVQDELLIAECLVAEARFFTGTETKDARKKLFVSAVKHLELALSKCEVKGRRAEYMHKIGDLYGWLRNLHEARNWFERALREYEEIGDVHGIGESLASLAAADREEKSPDKAIATLERLLKFSEGKPLHHLRAGALHDLATLKLSQGKVEEAKRGLKDAKALAEKHNFRDVLDALEVSLKRLEDAEEFHQPPERDFPTLIRELHSWCARYPKNSKAILPLWYYMHRTELWRICRSMLGVKFLICAVDSAAFRHMAGELHGQGNLFVWGTNFAIKSKLLSDWIPWSMDLLIPKGMGMIAFKELPDQVDPQQFINAVGKAMGSDAYVLVPFNAPAKAFPDTKIVAFGKHARLAPMIARMMLDTPAQDLITENKICLPLGQTDEAPGIIHIMHTAWENGMIPILSERLPHSDEIKAVCDNLLALPSGNESAASAAKESWTKLLSSCQDAPQKSLAEFSKDVAALSANAGGEKPLRMRIYLLRFQAGSKEVVHPAAVLLPS